MRKTASILLIGFFLLFFQNCSYDEQEVLEENIKITEELNAKMGNSNEEPVLEGCEIIFTFNDPNLTDSEKAAIRLEFSNNHFLIYSYTIISNTQEKWLVNCVGIGDYNNFCNGSGCITVEGCETATCGSSNHPKPKEPTDPFGSSN